MIYTAVISWFLDIKRRSLCGDLFAFTFCSHSFAYIGSRAASLKWRPNTEKL